MPNSHPERRKRSARFEEIALEANVSKSTVDRVLNERGSVSDAVRARVVAAARKLDVPRILPDTRHGVVHIDVLLTTHPSPFLDRLAQAVESAILALDRRFQVHRTRLRTRDTRVFERAVLDPPYPRDGLIVLCTNTPTTLDALTQAMLAGEPVATLVSDLPGLPPHHYAGIDHYQAGRTAGYWIGRLARRGGTVLILHGMDSVLAHDTRARGCRDALAEGFPALKVAVSPETFDEADLCYRFLVQALKQGDVAGVYDTGYGSAGIHAALQRFGMLGETVWIGHEMLDDHRLYLQQGVMDMVIDQNPDGQVRSALEYVLHESGQIDYVPRPELREFGLFTQPNVRTKRYLD